MPPLMFLIGSLLLLFGSNLLASPANEEIASALDDESGIVWKLFADPQVEIEVVEDAEAIGGTCLKVFVPSGAAFGLVTTAIDKPSRVSFRCKSGDATGSYFAGDTVDSRISIPLAQGVTGEWQEVQTRHDSNEYWGWRKGYGSYERTVYLDSILVESGFPIETVGWGAEVLVEPDKELYQKDEWVSIRAIPTEPDTEFLRWTAGPFDEYELHEASWQGRLSGLESDRLFEALAARRLSVEGITALVPRKGVEAEVISQEGESDRLLVAPLGDGAASVSFLVEGPGLLEFEERDPSPEDWMFDGWQRHSMRFGEGEGNYEVPIEGDRELYNFSFEPGYELSLKRRGDGTITKVAIDALHDCGPSFLLTAEPSEGWEFVRWEGSVDSLNPSVRVAVCRPESVTAVFAKPLVFGDLVARLIGSEAWKLAGEEIRSISRLPAGYEGTLEWRVEGPGRFEVDLLAREGETRFIVDERAMGWIQPDALADEFETFAFDFEEGSHLVELALDGSGVVARDFDISIGDVRWDAGYVVHVQSSLGGAVQGLPEGVSILAPGSALRLEAIPDDGYEFVGWSGSPDGATSSLLELVADQSLSLVAEFRRPAEGEAYPWVWSQSGDGGWSLVEGNWRSPESLAAGEVSTLRGKIEGPARLRLRLVGLEEPYPRATVTINEGSEMFVSALGDRIVELPSGWNEFVITASTDDAGNYAPFELTKFVVEYPVEIDVRYGEFNSTPALQKKEVWVPIPETQLDPLRLRWLDQYPQYWTPPQRFLKFVWTGYLEAGTELDFEAVGKGDMVFEGWTGRLAGKSAAESVVVDGPIISSGSFILEEFQAGDARFTVTPAESAFIQTILVLNTGVGACYEGPSLSEEEQVRFDESVDEATFVSTIQGPGVLFVNVDRGWGFDSLLVEARIDDGEFEELSLAKRIEFDEGEHEVVIRAKYSLVGAPSFSQRSPIVARLNYEEGFLAETPFDFGGVVERSDCSLVLPTGTTLELSALAHEGNDFLGWEAPFDGRPAAFELAVDEHRTIRARFRAKKELEALVWTYSGVEPVYEAPNESEEQGRFWWRFASAEGQKSARAETVVEGPGSLRISELRWEPYSYLSGPVKRRIYVDGLEIDAGGFGGWGSFFLPVAEGAHTVAIELDFRDEIESWPEAYISRFNVSMDVPVVCQAISVTAKSEYAEIQISSPDAEFAFGSLVSLTAPETDERGDSFIGWWHDGNYGYGEFFSAERELVLKVESDLALVARYGDRMPKLDGVEFATVGSGLWNLTEKLEDAVPIQHLRTTSRGATLSVVAQEDIMFSWASETSGDFILSASRKGLGGREIIAEPGQGRVYASFFLAEGEVLTLEIRTPDQGFGTGACSLEGFEVTPGWQPSYIADRRVALERNEASGTVAVGSASTDAFAGWLSAKREIDPSYSPVVKPGDGSVLRPIFFKYIATLHGTARANHTAAWGEGSQDGIPEESDESAAAKRFNWRSALLLHGPIENVVSMQLTGPAVYLFDTTLQSPEPRPVYGWGGVIYWGPFYPSGSKLSTHTHFLRATVNGETVEIGRRVGGGERFFLQIPEGEHDIAFIHAGSGPGSLTLRNLRRVSGYGLPHREYEGGEAFTATVGEFYESGQVVDYIARPKTGYRFVGWSAPFEDEDERIPLTVGEHPTPTPRFEQVNTFTLGGREWTVEGIAVELVMKQQEGEKSLLALLKSTEGSGAASWLETSVVGPVVLRLPAELSDEFRNLSIDGQPLNDTRFTSRFDSEGNLLVAVGEGSHRLRWQRVFSYEYGFSGDVFDQAPGHMLIARGAGVGVFATPAADVYASGEELLVEATRTGDVEWFSLDGGKGTVGSAFEMQPVEKSGFISAAKWRPVTLFGLAMEYAGSEAYESAALRNREVSYLKISGLAAGKLSFQISSSSTVARRLFVNGVEYEAEGLYSLARTLYFSQDDNVVIWEFAENGLRFMDESYFNVQMLEFEAIQVNEYLSWMSDYQKFGQLNQEEMDPRIDLDGDGVANFAEYVLDSNPILYDQPLEIELNAQGALQLKMNKRSVEQADLFRLNARRGKEAVEADTILDAPIVDENDEQRVVRTFREAPSSGYPILFYLEYKVELPTLDQLLID